MTMQTCKIQMTWFNVSVIPQLCLGHRRLDHNCPSMNADKNSEFLQDMRPGGEQTGLVCSALWVW